MHKVIKFIRWIALLSPFNKVLMLDGGHKFCATELMMCRAAIECHVEHESTNLDVVEEFVRCHFKRVLMTTLAENDSAELNVRAKPSCAVIIIRATCTQRFGLEMSPNSFVQVCCAEDVWVPRNSVEILTERIENRPCDFCDDKSGSIEIAICRPTHHGH